MQVILTKYCPCPTASEKRRSLPLTWYANSQPVGIGSSPFQGFGKVAAEFLIALFPFINGSVRVVAHLLLFVVLLVVLLLLMGQLGLAVLLILDYAGSELLSVSLD